LFAHIYKSSTLMAWKRGDIAIIDNIRMAHWRMNGVQGQRKLVQVQLGNFDANDLGSAELHGGVTPVPIRSGMKKAA
jgi:Taurine catabolism dioxygenase TauD, TfdA family